MKDENVKKLWEHFINDENYKQYFDIDNYSIKHSYWLPWLILFILIFPFFIIVIRHSGSQKLDIINNLNNYLDSKDHKYTSLISSYFNTNYSSIFIFIFVILVFTLFKLSLCVINIYNILDIMIL